MVLARTVIAASLLLVASAARADEVPFDPGERLTFKMTYFVMTAGEVNVQVGEGTMDGRTVWPVAAHLKTRGLVNRFFSLDNRFTSWFDPAQRRSIGNVHDADEDGDKHVDTTVMKGSQAFIRVERGGRVREDVKEMDPESNDVLSAIYRLRTLPLVVGETLQVPIFTGSKTWMLEVNVAGRERVKTPAGKYDALRLRCKTHFAGKYKSDRELEVWLSDDARRLPLKAEAFFYVATLRLELSSYTPGLVAARGLPHSHRQ